MAIKNTLIGFSLFSLLAVAGCESAQIADQGIKSNTAVNGSSISVDSNLLTQEAAAQQLFSKDLTDSEQAVTAAQSQQRAAEESKLATDAQSQQRAADLNKIAQQSNGQLVDCSQIKDALIANECLNNNASIAATQSGNP
jgi:hypothetical protein